MFAGSMKKLKHIFPWLLVGFVLLNASIQAIYLLPLQGPDNPDTTELILFSGLVIALLLVSVTFAAVGALIVTRASGNLVGWLLLIVAVNSSIPTPSILEIYFPSAPATLSVGLWLLLWLNRRTGCPSVYYSPLLGRP